MFVMLWNEVLPKKCGQLLKISTTGIGKPTNCFFAELFQDSDG